MPGVRDEGLKVEVLRAGRRLNGGLLRSDVTANKLQISLLDTHKYA